jgi:membrane-associated progesterone receptor component
MSGKFEPKQKVELDPPKDDPISLDYLSKCDGTLLIRLFTACVGHFSDETSEGTHEGYPTYVAIKVDQRELKSHDLVQGS